MCGSLPSGLRATFPAERRNPPRPAECGSTGRDTERKRAPVEVEVGHCRSANGSRSALATAPLDSDPPSRSIVGEWVED
ncbi:hypothetical protein R1flu_010990 [Riccia fluitans]|uniref:Uncharacterized protein n=1 Tax=Riccia fluitans TaxID=41844 RepID=A0ABD1Z6P1_9MARC